MFNLVNVFDDRWPFSMIITLFLALHISGSLVKETVENYKRKRFLHEKYTKEKVKLTFGSKSHGICLSFVEEVYILWWM